MSAQQLFDRALKEEPRSGALNMRVTFGLENGASGRGTTIADSLVTGAGAETAVGKPSREKLHFTERVAGRDEVSLDEVSTGEQGFIGVDGRWYRLSAAQYKRVFEPAKNETLVGALGFDPRKWLVDPKLEGTAHVGGVEANHITGGVDADAMLTDLGFFESNSGQSAEARRFTELLQSSKKHGTMDVFAGKQDGILRRISVAAQMEAAEGGPPVRATLTFAFGLHKVNQPVSVEAPKQALPPTQIAAIPRAKLGAEADDILGPPAQRPSGSDGRTRKRPGTGTHPKTHPSAQGYVRCVQAAEDLQALERCQALLP
jgi:hypothetical protein